MKRLNRRQASELAATIIKTFEGTWVDANVYSPDDDTPDTKPHRMVIPALKARRGKRKIEFVLPAASPYADSIPIRSFSVEGATYDEEDRRWTVLGQNGSLLLDLEPYVPSELGQLLKADDEKIARAVVAASDAAQADGYTKIQPAAKIGKLDKWTKLNPGKSERYYAQLISRELWPNEYTAKAVAMVTPSGDLVVLPLDGDAPWAQGMEEDLQRLIESSGGPEEALDYLYDRNSTRTAYAKPITINGHSPKQVASELAQREGVQ